MILATLLVILGQLLLAPTIPVAQNQAYQVTAVENGGTIAGRVTLAGEAPAPVKMLIPKDNEICGDGYREIQWVTVGEDGGLANVVVFLEHVKEGKAWATPEHGYLLDQTGCRFLPELFVIPKGETLAVANSDPVVHNIHTYEMIGRARRTMFNVGQPAGEEKFSRAIRPRRGDTVKVECDIHNFMHGWFLIADSPYYEIVEESGKFEMADVPPGAYTVKAWHPTLGVQKTEVTVETKGRTEVNFTFSAGDGS